MSNLERERSVFRYFDLADCFVEVRTLDPDTLGVSHRPGIDQQGYRRLVIQRCCPDFEDGTKHTLEMLFPEDPVLAADVLYQLCIEVNPRLDIHEVRLAVESPEDAAPGTQTETQAKGNFLDSLAGLTAGIEQRIARSVIGQPEALSAVSRALRKAAMGLSPEDRPVASFLFAGRTGTGKTELARSLARELFGSRKDALVRIDCTEFGEAHDVAKLIGSPPGYVGHEQGGQLTDAVRANPECVVLFDEVEKAHPRLHDLLLQILEEGTLTDSRGKATCFGHTLVVLTSNAGAERARRQEGGLGFGDNETLDHGELQALTKEAIDETFRPELLGRVDETLVFRQLGKSDVERIAKGMLAELGQRVARRSVSVKFTPAVARWMAARALDSQFGARALRRAVECEIAPRLADFLLENEGATRVQVRVRQQELAFERAA
ncbi:MAG: ATP-dependent Clp protease ATP-binding subunit ClpA [Planctomycetota bacterium]